jgi:glutamine amidotransferase
MITLIPANIDIPKDGLENGASTNTDGHGFAIASAHLGMEVFKSMRFTETLDALIEARGRHGMNSVVLFHSRWGTHGEFGVYNVHPFYVDEKDPSTVVAHNGIMPGRFHPLGKDRRSDTRIFVDWVTKPFCENQHGVPSPRGSKQLGKTIGSGNKLVFLSVKSGQPKVRIVNAHLGIQSGGVWYSNSGFRWASRSTGSSWSSRGSSSWWGDEDYWWRDKDGLWRQGTSYEDMGHGTISVIGGKKEDPLACPSCESVAGVDEASMVCWACDYCLDCNEFLDLCDCHVSEQTRRSLEAEFYAAEEPQGCTDESQPLRLVIIEDVAENGYVKVEGEWRLATSLIKKDVSKELVRVST